MKMTLTDGTVIDNLTLNGNNYVSQVEVSEDIFSDNVSEVTIEDDGNTFTLYNCILEYIRKYSDGWYIFLRELTPEEIRTNNDEAQIFFTAVATDTLME
jgi:hypothetical protein